ncbi:putative anti-sigma factor [Pedobacter sp. BAL39]|uniref:FecR family protein n=1 Tax=Pedobacter sp. BAL39 TaxID=391596 RepID=UPI000155AB58|nr:FecR domain-containing protein [Pedobacter sp. BAL39]EDM34199.1 putative anti-sigma factor [Pedobacter sp. BAL39]
MEQQRLSRLFSAYLEDQLDVEEERELMEFISRHSATDALEGQLGKIWDDFDRSALPDAGTELRIKNVMMQIRPRRSRILQFLPYAAAACLAIAIGFIYFFSNFNPGHNPQNPVGSHTLTTQYGQRKSIFLTDGTVVTLSPGSSITYHDDYNLRNRTVSFRGEAFFEVAKNPEKPFIVQHEGLYTRVLGTSFNIRAFDQEEKIDVTVATGRVEVGALSNATGGNKALAVLKPGQQLVYTKSAGLVKVNTLGTYEQVAAWKNDVLVLKGERFEEVALKLERWYNVRISFEHESLKNCRFKGSFKSLSVTALLDLLKKTAGFTYSIQDNHITIKGRGCL